MSLGIKTLEGVVGDVQVDIYKISDNKKPCFKYDYAYSLNDVPLEYSLESTKRNTLKGDYVVITGIETNNRFNVLCAYNLNSEECMIKPSLKKTLLISATGLFLIAFSLSHIEKVISPEALFIVPLLGIISYAGYTYSKEKLAQKMLLKRVKSLQSMLIDSTKNQRHF